MNSTKKTAGIAGLLYLVLIITGVFAEFFVRAEVYVSGDIAATATNIVAHAELYRIGFVSDLMMITAYFFLPLALYKLLSGVNESHARLMVISALVGATILFVNMLNHIAPLMLLTDSAYTSAFETEQLHALVSFFLDLHGKGSYIAQIFFGLWLWPLGYLAFRSGFVPRVIGIFLMLGCVGYLIDFFIYFLFPGQLMTLREIVTIFPDIGEFSMCIYLLVAGIRGLLGK